MPNLPKLLCCTVFTVCTSLTERLPHHERRCWIPLKCPELHSKSRWWKQPWLGRRGLDGGRHGILSLSWITGILGTGGTRHHTKVQPISSVSDFHFQGERTFSCAYLCFIQPCEVPDRLKIYVKVTSNKNLQNFWHFWNRWNSWNDSKIVPW